jgi:hypothetical protein
MPICPQHRWLDPFDWTQLSTVIRRGPAIAHLDHDPNNNRLRNLKALCQRCYMLYERPEHRRRQWRPCIGARQAATCFLACTRAKPT